jgi:hypothetical protein
MVKMAGGILARSLSVTVPLRTNTPHELADMPNARRYKRLQIADFLISLM